MNDKKPFLLSPAGKDYLWGGEKLKTEYGYDLPLTPLAEAWVCSAHPDGESLICSGQYRGRPLGEVLREHPDWLGTRAAALAGGELPVLVKLIDAKNDLSVQVHPDDAYARTHENQSGKTELWYILSAEAGAELVYGFSHDMTAQQVTAAVRDGTLGNHLQRVAVRAGDVFYIPPGTVHAIGGGILLAEIQQSSNVTYRLYDYDRLDKNGRKRSLHLARALEVATLQRAPKQHQQLRIIRSHIGSVYTQLCRSEHFNIGRIQLSGRVSYPVAADSFACILCTAGSGEVTAAGETLSLRKGGCAFVPAGAGETVLSGSMDILRISC